ncbi:MAG: hypothetical protein RLZZ488_1458 [Pseudomonadota bacterium]|jgi:hypothetical protein
MLIKSLFACFCLSVLSLSFAACSKKEAESASATEGKVSSVDFKILTPQGLSFDGTTLKGTGDAVAKLPLADNKDSGKNLTVTFTMEDGGSLLLKTFASSSLENGVNVHLTRSGDQLKVKTTKGNESGTEKTLSLSANGSIGLSVDVHNNESPTHVLVWAASEAAPAEGNALFNSESDGGAAGQGAENFWGLSLVKASVSGVVVGAVKFEEE